MSEKKLLYIFPEMAFTAILQETPKPNYFFVQAFHQINGQFMDDDNFIFDNLKKLFERIESGKYTVVLPDFLFTDTIVSVPKTQDMEIAEYLRDELLPKIDVSTFSHETRTSILLQRGKTSKVQLSAFEKELAATLKLAIGDHAVKVEEIVPLSWTLKAAVTLEPSITIAQVGERLYLAEHFVGINQVENAVLTDIEKLGETVKTLKGADPNLQTVYLLTSGLVEENLKKILVKVLPVQQLVEDQGDETQMPAYTKQIVEIAGRTLSLPEFVVPRFDTLVDEITTMAETEIKPPELDSLQVEAMEETMSNQEIDSIDEESEEKEEIKEEIKPEANVDATIEMDAEDLEKVDLEDIVMADDFSVAPAADAMVTAATLGTAAAAPVNIASVGTDISVEADSKEDKAADLTTKTMTEEKISEDDFLAIFQDEPEKELATKEEEKSPAETSMTTVTKALPKLAEATQDENQNQKIDNLGYNSTGRSLENKEEREEDKIAVNQKQTLSGAMSEDKKTTEENEDEAIDLSFFKPKVTDEKESKSVSDDLKVERKEEVGATSSVKEEKKEEKAEVVPMIAKEKKGKKKGSMSKFFKKLFLFLLIFVITIALGIGIGLAILKLTGKDFFNAENLPTPEPTALATPVPTPEPLVPEASGAGEASADADSKTDKAEEVAEEAELNPADYKVLVVNATGVSGYAGGTKTALEAEGFTKVTTGNSKGKYDESGVFVLMADKNSALIKALETASKKTLIYDEDYQTEDPKGTYDAVIVLNDKKAE